ncbi:MAG TPA: hypothetical protein VFK06_25060 [Candidatus Angelobacter sp.]|nr:hypothetical protein [Candidatus Angelobacter sp.]
MAPGTRVRKEEEIAANAFHQWLGGHGWTSTWTLVKPDPPDLHFHVSKDMTTQEWAVEVTRLFQYADCDGKEMNARYIQSLIDPLCDRLRSVVPNDSNYGYALLAAGPFSPQLLTVIEERAKAYITSGKTEEECLDYVEVFEQELANFPEETRSSQVLEMVESWVKPKARFFIFGASEMKGVTSLTWFHASAKTPNGNALAGHIRSTLEFSLQRILSAKLPSLQEIKNYQRKLLLLVQEYDYAEPDRLQEVLAGIKTPGVDAIFLIDSNGQAHLISDTDSIFEN